ncbi:hypothetical protein Tco_1261118 [Tanacetum coccineum]
MTSLVIRGDQDDQEGTPPLIKVQIEGHIYALKSLIKNHNKKNTVDPIRLDFELEDTKVKGNGIVKGKMVVEDDLKKPFKEALKTPFTYRIIEFAGPKYKMPTNIKLYDGATDPEDHLSRFASAANSREWPMPKLSPRWNFPRVKLASILGGHFFRWFGGTIVPTEITRGKFRRNDDQGNPKGRENYGANRGRDNRAPYPPPRGDYLGHAILEKGHHTIDCIQLRKQLEMVLESGKLNHLVRDVRQRGRGNQRGEAPQNAKVINMIRVRTVKENKRKAQEVTKVWMNSPITFPPVSAEDISDEPIIIEAKVEGYLVRLVYVDEWASVDVMFEHCFENLSPSIKDRLRETQMDLVGFTREVTKPLGKIELKAIPSTIHSMTKFPTLRGTTTLVTQSAILSECRRLDKKQIIEEEPMEK